MANAKVIDLLLKLLACFLSIETEKQIKKLKNKRSNENHENPRHRTNTSKYCKR